MKPDRYEVTRDATGKATAVPVFDQPYGMVVDGQVVQTPEPDSGYANYLRDFDSAYASEFYDGIPTTGQKNSSSLYFGEVPTDGQNYMSGGQVGKLWSSHIIGPDGEVLRGADREYHPPIDPDKLQIAGTLVEGQPGKYHYMGGVHYDPTLAQINTSTPNALTPVDPQIAAIRRMQRDHHANEAINRLHIGKIASSHRTLPEVAGQYVSPEDLDYIRENNMVAVQQSPHQVFSDRVDYYTDFMKQGSLKGKLPGFLGPLATIGTATAAAFAPQETQAMSKEQADLLSQFDQGFDQLPKSRGDIFVESVKDSALSDMSFAPGTVAGERVVNALIPQSPMVMQTPHQYGLTRVIPRMAGGLGMGLIAAPETQAFLTGDSDYDPNVNSIQVGPIDVGRIPYHFNRTVFGTADPIGAIGNAFTEEMKNPSPFAVTLRNSMDF